MKPKSIDKEDVDYWQCETPGGVRGMLIELYPESAGPTVARHGPKIDCGG